MLTWVLIAAVAAIMAPLPRAGAISVEALKNSGSGVLESSEVLGGEGGVGSEEHPVETAR